MFPFLWDTIANKGQIYGNMAITSEVGDRAIWITVIGQDTPALGEMKNTKDVKQNQIAKALVKFSGLDYQSSHQTLKAGKVVKTMIE